MTLTAKGQRTEAALLDAARMAFAKFGYLNTKISDIAEAAGRSTASFYNYYENKEQLLVALLEEFTADTVEISFQHSEGPAEGVRAAVRAYWNNFKKHLPELVGVFQLAMTDIGFRRQWQEFRRPGVEGILVGLRAAERAGVRLGQPADLLASALVSAVESFCWTWLAWDGDTGVHRPSDEEAVEVLSAIWYAAVYGSPLPRSGTDDTTDAD